MEFPNSSPQVVLRFELLLHNSKQDPRPPIPALERHLREVLAVKDPVTKRK